MTRAPCLPTVLIRARRHAAIVLVLATFALPGHAIAQDVTSDARWELAVQLGITWPTNAVGGLASRPPPAGPSFPAVGSPLATTRAVSSWFFGDGAALFNRVVSVNGLPSGIVPLDPALQAGVTRVRGGPALGVSVARWLSHRVALELGADYSPTAVVLDERTLSAIETTSLSYSDAWVEYLQSRVVPDRVPSDVLVSAEADKGGGHQLVATAELKLVVRERRRSRIYVAGGAGVARSWTRAPHATLAGTYSFWSPARSPSGDVGLVPFTEHDEIAIHVQVRRSRRIVGAVRGGYEYYIESRRGIRFEFAMLLSPHDVATVLDVRPSVTVRESGGAVSGFTSPTIQFSNQPEGFARSSLSGAPLEAFVASRAEGLQSHLKISAAYFWRF